MSYREVHVVEVREVVRLWSRGESLRSISRRTGLDRKTVSRYVKAAQQVGCKVGEEAQDAALGEVIGRVRAQGPGVRGGSWQKCAEHRELLAGWLEKQVPLSKVQELLARHTGVVVPYRTLHRYAVRELGFGGRRVPPERGRRGGRLRGGVEVLRRRLSGPGPRQPEGDRDDGGSGRAASECVLCRVRASPRLRDRPGAGSSSAG